MKTVNELLLKYNCPNRTQKAKTKIEQIQKKLNFNLPNDHLFFLQNYSGFEQFIGLEFVRLWDIDEIIGANIDYQIFENLPKTLAIGGNGSSEFIAIEQTVDNSIMVVLTHFIDLDKQYHIEIGISLVSFGVSAGVGAAEQAYDKVSTGVVQGYMNFINTINNSILNYK